MNCAPVTIIDSGKRSESGGGFVMRRAVLDSLPDMFKANIGNGCGTAQQGSCVVFPSPGTSVETNTCPFDQNHMFTGSCEATNNRSVPTNTGGVFVPVVSSAAIASAPTAPISRTTQETYISAVPSPTAPIAGGNGGSSCTAANYGQVICSTDGTQIGICDYGGKVIMGPVAAGTRCVNGSMIAARDAHA
jgi:hypothetical protein